MLSIEKVRELIEGSEKYSDEEITQIRDELHSLAEIIFDQWMYEQKKKRQKDTKAIQG